MATVRDQGYQSVIKRALENYREMLEMTADTCTMVSDHQGHREVMKEWARVGLTLKKLERERHGTT